MSGSSLTAPSSINDVRTKAHLLLGERMGKIDLTPILVYTVTSAPDSALPFLAWQFDVLSPFWQLLASNEGQRQLIANGVALHRQLGTPATIIAALSSMGFVGFAIQEGQNSWGGDSWPSDQGWAVFRVLAPKTNTVLANPQPSSWDSVSNIDLLIDIDDIEQAQSIGSAPVSAATQALALAAIDFFKPKRCWLDSLWFQEPPISDAVAVTDFLTIVASNYIQEAPLLPTDFVSTQGWAISDTKSIAPIYNKHFFHAGILYGPPQPAVADSGITVGGQPVE